MKLTKEKIEKIEEKLGVSLIDFSKYESSYKTYRKSSSKILPREINQKAYLVKTMDKKIARHYKNTKIKNTYINSVYSEYISCKIGKMLELNIQEVILGYNTEKNKKNNQLHFIPSVACKDFCEKGEELIEFETIFEGVNNLRETKLKENKFKDI